VLGGTVQRGPTSCWWWQMYVQNLFVFKYVKIRKKGTGVFSYEVGVESDFHVENPVRKKKALK
jgi:hypothetical protein